MSTLTINLSSQLKLVDGKGDFLDLKGKISGNQVLDVNDFGKSEEIYPYGLELYKNYIQELLNSADSKEFLKLKVDDFPIYWWTETAIKHPITFWAKDFFLLLAILDKGKEVLNRKYSKISIFLPKEVKNFQSGLVETIKAFGIDAELKIVYHKEKERVSFLKLVKACLGNFKLFITFKKHIDTNKLPKEYTLFVCNHSSDKHTLHKLFEPLKSLHEDAGKKLVLIPFLEWLKVPFKAFNLPKTYIDSKPGFFQLINLNFQIIWTYIKLKQVKTPDIQLGKLSFSGIFLQDELARSLLYNIHLIYAHRWLKNFFRDKKRPSQIYFEDEFYATGKTIASAARSQEGIIATGIQHGHFNEIHTVYNLSQEEKLIQNGNPLPHNFVVWGKYYKDVFEKNGTIETPRVLVLGNPAFIESKQEKQTLKPQHILWCMTTWECCQLEWEILKASKFQDHFDLKIRLHPLAHIREDQLTDLLAGYEFSISKEKNIKEAFQSNPLVVTSAHSTVFLDSLVNQLFCCRLISNRWVGSSEFTSRLLHDIRTGDELDKVLDRIVKQSNTVTGDDALEFLNLDPRAWQEFIRDT